MTNKKNYLLNLLSNFGKTFIVSLIGYVSVPISLNYFDSERYGIWTIISSILIYLSISNLGLNGAASILMAKNNNFNHKIIILKRSTKILLISTLIFYIFFFIINFYTANWIYFLGKIPLEIKNESYQACYILIFFFFLNLPFTIISSAFYGYQKVYIDNLFLLLNSIFTFISLLLVVYLRGNLITFAYFNGISNLLINAIRLFYFYYFIVKKISYVDNLVDNDVTNENIEISYKNIFITGIRFLSVGIAAMIVWNTDNLVLSHFLGLKSVTSYSITFKLYNIMFMIISIINGSILPIFGKEFGKNNWEWLDKTYQKILIFVTIVGGATWLSGILFFKDVIYLWTGEAGYAGMLTLFFLGAYSYLLSMVNLNASVVQAFNYMDLHWLGWHEAVIKIISSIILLKYYGIAGVALGTVLGSLFSPTIILPIMIVKRTNYKIKYHLNFVLKHFFMLILFLILGLLIQFYIKIVYLKAILGFFVLLIYMFISYILIPKDFKNYFYYKNWYLLFKY